MQVGRFGKSNNVTFANPVRIKKNNVLLDMLARCSRWPESNVDVINVALLRCVIPTVLALLRLVNQIKRLAIFRTYPLE